MKLILASNNKGKIKEVKAILAPKNVDITSMAEIGFDEDIEESGVTLHENAFLKASAIYEKYGIPVLSDDSGLFIDALQGKPGVHSARYAGEHKNDKDNIAKVLSDMESHSNRSAHFACVMCLIIDGTPIYFEGKVHGTIAFECSGDGGFGYDPIFIPQGESKSFGELDAEYKNTFSHRARALDLLLQYFETQA
jgi:XTP/dITP diphosphohydrolase